MSIGGKLTDFKHGSNAAATTLVSYKSSIKSIDFPMTAEEVEQTVFGSGFREYEASFKSAEISVVYKYTDAMWTVLKDLWSNQTTVDFAYSPDGTAGGKPKVEGLAASGGGMVLLDLSTSPAVGEALDVNARFRSTGVLTFGTN